MKLLSAASLVSLLLWKVAKPFWWGVLQTKMSVIWVLSSVLNPLWKKLCRRPFYGLHTWTAFCSTMFPTPWTKFQSRISIFTIQQCTAKGLLSLSKSLGFRFLQHTAAAQHQVLEVELRIIDTSQSSLPSPKFQVCNLYFLPCVESRVQRVSSFSPARVCSTKKIPFWGFFVCISSFFAIQ